MPKITPCLWFDTQAEDAAAFYTSVFPRSRVLEVSRYGEGGPREPGLAMVVRFELDGQEFQALNGGPGHEFDWSVSFSIDCADQDEVDHYWTALSEGGEESQCGWLKDRFGLWWQVVPRELPALVGHPDPATAQRAMAAMMTMRKIDIAEIRRAAEAVPAG